MMGEDASTHLADRDRIPHLFAVQCFLFHDEFRLQDHFAVDGADDQARFFCLFE
jgi:hypothetical protein